MVLPPKPIDKAFEALLQELPADLEATAREFKAFARARQVPNAQELMRMVLLFSGLDQTLREVAGTMTLLGMPMSDEAVRQRLAACRPWVKALLDQLLPPAVRHALPDGLRFQVIDGSTVQGPGAEGIWYRVHIALDLVSLELRSIAVTDRKTGEKLGHYPLGAGDVALADRGYCHRQGIHETLERNAHVIVRYNAHNLPLSEAGGEAVDIMAELKRVPKQCCLQLYLPRPDGDGPAHRVWVHARRLPAAQAAAARRRCRRNAKRRQPKKSTLYLAGWVLVLSTLPPAVLDTNTVLALYRVRWQVELTIKRWKSLLDLDQLRAREGSPLAPLWLHGKLLYAQLLERRARAQLPPQWGDLDQPRSATWWRVWKLLKQPLDQIISAVALWNPQRWADCMQKLAERSRRRPLQQLPEPLKRLRFGLPTALAAPAEA
ncbi:MAG TPA: transposase [Acidobacteriota bacterium]|nr:transposase [Acidobacteriota bacterium]